MLRINGLYKVFNQSTPNEKVALRDLDLHLATGDFLTIIGGNGSGKSTLLNLIAGVYLPDGGKISIDHQDITSMSEHKRAAHLGRVFQDPLMGSAGEMTIEENLALAERRGLPRGFAWGLTKRQSDRYREILCELDLGLEDRMSSKVGLLSGGQRQALTLLMATLQKPKVLLLDEHTAALDPKTAAKVLELTDKLVNTHKLTTIMVTHNMRDAIKHGNRVMMMSEGDIIYECGGAEKACLTPAALYQKFSVTEELFH